MASRFGGVVKTADITDDKLFFGGCRGDAPLSNLLVVIPVGDKMELLLRHRRMQPLEVRQGLIRGGNNRTRRRETALFESQSQEVVHVGG